MMHKSNGRHLSDVQHAQRASSFEFLRIAGMFLLVLNHLLGRYQDTNTNLALHNIAYFVASFGGVGDDVFFGITAWFLCMIPLEKITFRRQLKRIWVMEHQIWFYTIILLILSLAVPYVRAVAAVTPSPTKVALAVYSVAPLISNLWWYVTSYAVFLVFYPVINKGLRLAGRRLHAASACAALLIWAILPHFEFGMDYSVLLFAFQYLLVSYYRWYGVRWLESKHVVSVLLTVGVVSGIVASFVDATFLHYAVMYFNSPWKFPALCIAAGLLLWADRHRTFHSNIINTVASYTLAPYIVLNYPLVIDLLYKLINVIDPTANEGWLGFGTKILVGLLFYVVVLSLDAIRHGLFSLGLDQHIDRGFEYLAGMVEKRGLGIETGHVEQ